ncbi:helix-turn-helix domain-containing protein [Proteobacteria bacterium 005FR1]|nr:helix-turn-helix domain-containing protein [Proteobacteria bacterium 005FR1]
MNSDVGARMLVLRKLNGWSQRQLAKRAGVPHSAISMIEHGQVSPSINSLQKVLDGVPMTLAEFFALDLDMQIRVFFRHEDISNLSESGITRASIQGKGGDQAVCTVHEIYPPGSDTGEEPLINNGEMIGFISAGSLEVTIGGESELLKAGDGFHFERRRPHRFRNLGKKTAELVATLVPASKKIP